MMAVLKGKILIVSLVFLGQVFAIKSGTDNETIVPIYTIEMDYEKEINSFGLDLYHSLAKKSGDLCFSPYSVSSALAMCSAGAMGNTLIEIFKAFNFSEERGTSWTEWFAGQMLQQARLAEGITLEIANKLYAADGFEIWESYETTLSKFFKTTLEILDFRDSIKASTTINNWVANVTKNKITELFKSADFDETTKLVLANAIYFKAAWKNEFDPKKTEERDFHVNGSKVIKMPMMHTEAFHLYNYIRELDVDVLELPYKGGEFSMLILLPNVGVKLGDVEQKLTAEQLASLVFFPTAVDIILPKFKVEASYELNEDLKALGINDFFDCSKANLEGISPKKPFFVSKVVHKSFVEVNEEGAEAAGATGLSVKIPISTAPMSYHPFHANRPFLFLIRQNANKLIYFIGRYTGQ